MFMEFSASNFRSIRERQTISLVSTKSTELRGENTFSCTTKTRLLKTAVVYGANASGKSNLFKALAFFLRFTVTSAFKQQIGEAIRTEPFLFDTESIKQPAEFEIIFMQDKVRYRYGFAADTEKIHREWLFAVLNVQEVKLFTRIFQDIDTSAANFKEGVARKEFARENTTFLSVCAQHNGEVTKKIIEYLSEIGVTSGLANNSLNAFTMIKNDASRKNLVDFLKFADIQVVDLKSERKTLDLSTIDDQDLKDFLSKKIGAQETEIILFGHSVYKGGGLAGVEYLELKEESSGTQKVFEYAGPILRALEKGTPLFIDEFDSRLHPLIIEGIIRLFHSPETNPKNAQLVVSCHAVNIMTNKIFRRDQIWFCEKKQNGATELYSLVEYDEPVRKDASFGKSYLLGKYGAVPYLGQIHTQTECAD